MVPWFGSRRLGGTRSQTPLQPPFSFPDGFLWGTATAAYQIEHTQPDDWSAFEREVMKSGSFAQLEPGKAIAGHIHNLGSYSEEVRRKKTDFDSRIAEDIAMMAAMKHNAYRFSIAWARLFPRPGMSAPDPEGLAFYRRVFDELEHHKLTPVVTLFHFTTPEWFWEAEAGKRGWDRADAIEKWEQFVRAVIENFGARIPIVCTINEPMVYVYAGYLEGIFPPHQKLGGPKAAIPVIKQLLRAHALAYRLFKEDAARRKGQVLVGYAHHMRAFEPLRNYAPLDRVTARMIEQAFIWDFSDAVSTGILRVAATRHVEVIPGLAGTQDYVGVNYYGRFYVKTNLLAPTKFEVLPHDPETRAEDRPNDLGWASYPRGFRRMLELTGQRYRLPIYVLENGTAENPPDDDDRERQRLLVENLRELWLARQYGADVRGYFHWSFLDNFEWAEGFEPRFGLVRVDYQNGFRRIPRKSAALYTRIIEKNALEPEVLAPFGL